MFNDNITSMVKQWINGRFDFSSAVTTVIDRVNWNNTWGSDKAVFEKIRYSLTYTNPLDHSDGVKILSTYMNMQAEKRGLTGKYKYPIYMPKSEIEKAIERTRADDPVRQSLNGSILAQEVLLNDIIKKSGYDRFWVDKFMVNLYWATKDSTIKTRDFLDPRSAEKNEDYREEPDSQGGIPKYLPWLVGGGILMFIGAKLLGEINETAQLVSGSDE